MNQITNDINVLYTAVPESKKDKRGEEDYRTLQQDMVNKMTTIVNILLEDPDHALEALVGDAAFSKLNNIRANRLALFAVLSTEHRTTLLQKTAKVLIKESVMHELPLNSASAMIAKFIEDHRLFNIAYKPIKDKIEQGDLDFLAANILMKIAHFAKLFTIAKKEARYTLDGHIPSYDIVKPTLNISENLYKYLEKKENIEPKDFPENANSRDYDLFAGSHNKRNSKQPQFVLDRLNKLNNVAFTFDHEFYDKYKIEILSTFPNAEEQHKLISAVPSMIDRQVYFKWKYGPDNGRFYGSGYLFPSQAGGRNWMMRFAKARPLTERGVYWLEKKIADYEKGDVSKLPYKKRLEYYNYVDAMEKHRAGKPVNNFIGIDGEMMGPQTLGLLFRCKDTYTNAVTKEGRKGMASILEMSIDAVKGGESPYGYGAGEMTTLHGIKEAGGVLTETTWKLWEKSFQAYYPAMYDVRQFIKKLMAYIPNPVTVLKYETWGGFKADITSLNTITTHHDTVFGKNRDYTREALVRENFGSKVIAVLGSMLDSSILAFLLDELDIDIKPVHDEYCVHPNDVDILIEKYIELAKQLAQSNFFDIWVQQIFVSAAENTRIDTSSLYKNTLDLKFIKGGIA